MGTLNTRRYLYRSLGGTITAARGHGSGIWTISQIPIGLRRAPEAIERRFGTIGKTYPKLTFDKDRVIGYSDIEFVGPGHPLFEMVIERVLTQYGEALRSGATITDQLRLSLETYLEDLIIEQWAEIDFGADLFFVDRQMQCGDLGYLDILATDKKTTGFVVIELKRDQGDDQAFGQLCRYMGWVGENMEHPGGVPVAGIIIAAEITPKLEAAAKTNRNVRLVEYAIRLELSPKGNEQPSKG